MTRASNEEEKDPHPRGFWLTCMSVGKKVSKTVCGPVFDYALYYYDLYSDIALAVTMATNCHFKVWIRFETF